MEWKPGCAASVAETWYGAGNTAPFSAQCFRDIGKPDFITVRVPEFGVYIRGWRWEVDMLGLREGAGREAGGESSARFRGEMGERFHHLVLRGG